MKKIFLLLLVCAIGVWGYVVVQVVLALLGKEQQEVRSVGTDPLPAAAMLSMVIPSLDTNFRDPFQTYLYAEKPISKITTPVNKVPVAPKVIDPPKAVLNGILWGDPPVAILKQDGQTELVKEGAEIWDIKVMKIERNQVLVRKQGRQFTLGY